MTISTHARRMALLSLVACALALVACDLAGDDFVDHDSFDPTVIWTGTEHAAVWRKQRFDGTGRVDIMFQRVDADGHRVGDAVAVSSSPGGAFFPTVASSGTEYAVAWMQQTGTDEGIYVSIVSSAGGLVAGPHHLAEMDIQGADDVTRPSIFWAGDTFVMTWARPGDDGYAVETCRVDADGQRVGDVVAVTGQSEGWPMTRAAWTGSVVGVLMSDVPPWSGQPSDAVVVRFDADGVRLDDLPFGSIVSYHAALARGVGVWGVTWESPDDVGMSEIHIGTVADDGTASDPVQVSDAQGAVSSGWRGGGNNRAGGDYAYGSWLPGVVWTGVEFLVVWVGTSPDPNTGIGLIAATVDDQGQVVEAAHQIFDGATGTAGPLGLCWGGDHVGVAWHGAGSFSFASGPLDHVEQWF